jgi:hypothetical protein
VLRRGTPRLPLSRSVQHGPRRAARPNIQSQTLSSRIDMLSDRHRREGTDISGTRNELLDLLFSGDVGQGGGVGLGLAAVHRGFQSLRSRCGCFMRCVQVCGIEGWNGPCCVALYTPRKGCDVRNNRSRHTKILNPRRSGMHVQPSYMRSWNSDSTYSMAGIIA